MTNTTLTPGTTSGLSIIPNETVTAIGPMTTLTSSNIEPSGTVVLESGAVGSDITVDGAYALLSATNGSDVDSGTIVLGTSLIDNSTDRNTVIESDGRETLQNYALGFNETLQGASGSPAVQLIQTNSTAQSVLVLDGAQTTTDNGVAINTKNEGGIIQALNGGTIISAINISGTENVLDGVDIGSTIENGATLNIGLSETIGTFVLSYSGYATNDLDYGRATVTPFGTFVQGTIGLGGSLTEQSGGIVSGLIFAGGTANISGTIGGTIDFSGTANGVLSVASTANVLGGTGIENFVPGDTLILGGASSFSYNTATGTLSANSSVSLDVSLQAGETLVGTIVGSGLEITATGVQCFAAGTRIKTSRGLVAVEKLETGDRVSTQAGKSEPVIWIGRRDYDGRFIVGNHLALPVCILQGALADGIPSRDLFVSPGHGIFLGGLLVPAWRLVNGVSVTQAKVVDFVSYYHIELATHEILLAENCPAESFFDIGDRGQFQNASIINGDSAPMVPLPRVEGGHLLHMIQSQINARAGITLPAAPQIHLLRGCIDLVTPGVVEGWAQDAANPESPVDLIIQIGDQIVGRALANEWRPDLRKAGLGSGCHGFKAKFPAEIAGEVIVRSYPDGTVLSSTNTSDFHQAYNNSLAVAGF